MQHKTAQPNLVSRLKVGAAVFATILPLFAGCVKKEIVQPSPRPKTEIVAKKQPLEDFLKTWDVQNSTNPGKQLKGWEQKGENLTFTKTVKQGDFVMLPLKTLPNSIGLGVMRVDEVGVGYIICSSFLGENPCNPPEGPMIGKVNFNENKTAFRFTTGSDDEKHLITVQLDLGARKGAQRAADLTFTLSLHLENLAMHKSERGEYP